MARGGFVSCRGAAEAVRQLQAAGVPILAGSDAPNPGTGYGVTLHGEMALLVKGRTHAGAGAGGSDVSAGGGVSHS